MVPEKHVGIKTVGLDVSPKLQYANLALKSWPAWEDPEDSLRVWEKYFVSGIVNLV